jgi:hypothetical protein
MLILNGLAPCGDQAVFFVGRAPKAKRERDETCHFPFMLSVSKHDQLFFNSP